MRRGAARLGFLWFSLFWWRVGSVWLGSVWFGWVRFGLVWSEVWPCVAYGLDWFFGLAWFRLRWVGLILCIFYIVWVGVRWVVFWGGGWVGLDRFVFFRHDLTFGLH